MAINKNPAETYYQYDVSVIIPVFNARPYLQECFDSLITNRDKINFEVICIDDGSTDGSLPFLHDFAKNNPEFKVITNRKKGVSSARNAGFCEAEGKYILLLDSDDKLSDGAAALLFQFLEDHTDVDIAAYPLYQYTKGKRAKLPPQKYQFLDETGVYDVNDSSFHYDQSGINHMFRNDKTRFFDEEMKYGEDQAFATSLILEKGRLGYVKEAEYHYRIGIQSTSAILTDKSGDYESYYGFFESIKEKYTQNGRTIPYIQNLLLGTFGYLFSIKTLFAHHFRTEDAYQKSKERILKIFDTIEDEKAISYKHFDPLMRYIFFKLTGRKLGLVYENGSYMIKSNENIIWQQSDETEIAMAVFKVAGDKVRFIAKISSPLFDMAKAFALFLAKNSQMIGIPHFASPSARDNFGECFVSQVYIDTEFSIDMLKSGCALSLSVEGRNVPIYVQTDGKAADVLFCGGKEISIRKDGRFTVRRRAQIISLLADFMRRKSPQAFILDLYALTSRIFKQVWIYCDEYAPGTAMAQFTLDRHLKDGVKRYYVTHSRYGKKPAEVNGDVVWGSRRHLFLQARARVLISSSVKIDPRNWFYRYTKNFLRTKWIFLPVFPLAMGLPVEYARDSCFLDVAAARSERDKEELVRFGYKTEDILCAYHPEAKKDTGAKEQVAQRKEHLPGKILLSLTWREYLVRFRDGELIARKEDFDRSPWAAALHDIFTSDTLRTYLADNNLTLDVLLHPFMQIYEGEFAPAEHIRFVEACELFEYRALISDFTAIEYEALALGIPVIRFVPDEVQLKNCLHSSIRLNPQEPGKPFLKDADGLVRALESTLGENRQNDGETPPVALESDLNAAVHEFIKKD